MAALLRRYYAAAARDDGAAACRLVYPVLAEAVPEDDGPTGPANPRGDTCASVLSKLFEQVHARLRAEADALRVIAVRVDLNRGAAEFASRGMRSPRYTIVQRERGAWKMDLLFDDAQPIHVE